MRKSKRNGAAAGSHVYCLKLSSGHSAECLLFFCVCIVNVEVLRYNIINQSIMTVRFLKGSCVIWISSLHFAGNDGISI